MDWYNDQVEECTVYVSLSEVSTYSLPIEGFGSRFVSALSADCSSIIPQGRADVKYFLDLFFLLCQRPFRWLAEL